MSASALIHIWLKVACFRFHVPFVPDCFVWPLGCFAVDFGQIPFHIVLSRSSSSCSVVSLFEYAVGCIAMFLEELSRLASSATSGKKAGCWWSAFPLWSSAAMHGFGCSLSWTWWRSPCSCCVLEPGGLNRFDPCDASGVRAFDAFTA